MKKLILIFLLFSVNLYAAPSSIEISGTLSDGETITISGEGFGSGDTTPLLWEQFEDGENGNTITGNPDIGTWTLHGSNPPTYSSTHAHGGSLASQSGTSGTYSQFHTDISSTSGDSLYISFWWYLDMNGATSCVSIKLMQIWGSCNGSCSGADCVDYNPGFMTGDGGAGDWQSYTALESKTANGGNSCYGSSGVIDYPADPIEDAWHLIEFRGKQSSADVANGSIAFYVDGTAVYNQSNIVTHTLDEYWDQINIWDGYQSCDAALLGWVDDAYISDTWARVEIGNSDTYANCTHREIQIPTAWSDTSITVTVNQGSFSAEDTVYLFVVDSDGATGVSGALTIGSGSSSTPTCQGISIQ